MAGRSCLYRLLTTTYDYDENGALTESDDGTTVNAYAYDYDGYLPAFDTTGTIHFLERM